MRLLLLGILIRCFGRCVIIRISLILPRSHIRWDEALEPNGPLKPGIVEKIRRQFGDDPARWRREMEADVG